MVKYEQLNWDEEDYMEKEKLKFQVGQNVVYKRHCVYEITDIKEEKICAEKKTYYVLSSVYDNRASVYVPTDSKALTSQMREPLSFEDVHEIIEKSKNSNVEWIEERSARFKYFDELMARCELAEVLCAYVLVSRHKEDTLSRKLKFFAHDERTLQAAQNLLCEAFAFSLGMAKSEVIPYITEKLG